MKKEEADLREKESISAFHFDDQGSVCCLTGTLADSILEIAHQINARKSKARKASKKQRLPLVFYFEYCTNCVAHDWHTHHEPGRYEFYLRLVQDFIRNKIPQARFIENNLPQRYRKSKDPRRIWDQGMKRELLFPRLGAFELYWNSRVVFSKRETGMWPDFRRTGKQEQEEAKSETHGWSETVDVRSDTESSEEEKLEEGQNESLEEPRMQEELEREEKPEVGKEQEEIRKPQEVEEIESSKESTEKLIEEEQSEWEKEPLGEPELEEDDWPGVGEQIEEVGRPEAAQEAEEGKESQVESESEEELDIEITMGFEVELPLHRVSTKIFPFPNNEPVQTTIQLSSSHPKLLRPKDKEVRIGPHSEGRFELRFLQVDEPGERQCVLSVFKNGEAWENILFSLFYRP